MFRLFRRNREKGASLVEFAVVLPLLLLLVFGIMEAGWLFSQQVEVRNASREGARLAVVDYGTVDAMRTEVCDRAALSAARAEIGFDLRTETAQVTVQQTYESLTGVVPQFGDGIVIRSVTEMRLEQEIDNWSDNGTLAGCP